MSKGSCSSVFGALAIAVMLAGCGGGGAATANAPVVIAPNVAPAVARILVSVNGTPEVGNPGTYTLTIKEQTSDGTTISGTYKTPITLTNSDTSGATKLSTTSVPTSTTAVSLNYNGVGGSTLGGFNGATITASSGPLTGQVAFLGDPSVCGTIKDIKGLYPCDLQSAYSLPSMAAGAGQTVAVVDAFDDPNAEADMNVYRSTFGLAACTTANGCFRKVNQTGVQGSYPAVDQIGWSVEASLDLDMVSAICPNCHILFVEANTDNSLDLSLSVDEAALLGATQISNSYGGSEFPEETQLDSHFNHPSAAITVSSGDRNYGVQWPSSSPYVTAVGGTNLVVGANARGWNEFVWNNAGTQGAGSGCSLYEPKPAWQHDTGCPNRMVADVSAVGDPYTGVAIYDTFIVLGATIGGWAVEGGTSVAAPIIAGVYALGGAGGTALNYGSSSYGHMSALNDVTNGSNGSCSIPYFCTAEVGYDGPTGNGTPSGIGAFGGPALIAAQSIRAQAVRRHVLQAAVGTPFYYACPLPKPGFAACNAIVVKQ